LAGVMKRQQPAATEEELVLTAIWDLVGPRLVFRDVPLFRGLLADLFPGVSKPDVPTSALREAIESELQAQHVEVCRCKYVCICVGVCL
jgi:dynein heavy chain, axonemal